MSRRGYRWIEDPEGLERLASALADAPEHALDTESNSGFAYRERLCLLQLNVLDDLWLVDLVALGPEPEALEPLRGALESPKRTTYLHGGEFDVACLKRDYGIALEGVWDSQQAASLLGRERTGYGTLVEEICGVKLPKAHSFFDWGRRPLPEKALRYAVDDVRYLPAVCRKLSAEVAAAELEDEVAIANRAVQETRWEGGFRPEAIWRIKGIGRLDRAALPLLVALHRWREEAARRRDQPPGRLLNNALLLALARASPRREADLRRLGLSGGRLAELGPDLLKAVRAARQRPPAVPEPPPSRRPSAAEQGREKRLKKWRRKEAARRGVSEQAVLPTTALQHLARHGASDLAAVPQLGAHRRHLYAHHLRRLCR